LKDYVRTSLEFFSTALGPAFIERWGVYGGAGVAAVFLSGAAALAIIAFTKRCQPIRVLNLAFFLSGWLCVFLALVWGRAPFGETGGSPSRYYTLVVPGLCGVYWAWMIFRGLAGRLMQLLLMVLVTGTFLANIRQALEFGGMFRYATSEIEKAATSGRPLPVVAQMYANYFGYHNYRDYHEAVLPCFRALQQLGFEPYQFAPREPPLTHELFPLGLPPVEVRDATWENGTCRILGERPTVVLALPSPRFVYAIRFTYRYDLAVAESCFRVYWRRGGTEEFDDMRSMTFHLPVKQEEQTFTIYICEEIDQLRVQPAEHPGVLHLSKIELLLPATADP
jgi:hypothetical protein